MQRLSAPLWIAGAAALLAGLALWLWGLGGADRIAHWAAQQQREVQGDLAGALRAVRTGQPWALGGLLGLCFAYGFFHAAGPGHGKLVMGGYALGEDVSRARLIGLTIAGALGQAVTAIALVSVGALVLGWGRIQMQGLADGRMAALSAGAIVLVGLWLVLRGLRHWAAAGRVTTCSSCGHAHGPAPEDIARTTGWKDAAALVGAVAIRPCTGAIFVLILTFSMGIAWAGILGALVMALGTAVLTLGVALGAGYLRGGLAERLNGPGGQRAMAGVEIIAGGVVAVVAMQVALRLV